MWAGSLLSFVILNSHSIAWHCPLCGLIRAVLPWGLRGMNDHLGLPPHPPELQGHVLWVTVVCHHTLAPSHGAIFLFSWACNFAVNKQSLFFYSVGYFRASEGDVVVFLLRSSGFSYSVWYQEGRDSCRVPHSKTHLSLSFCILWDLGWLGVPLRSLPPGSMPLSGCSTSESWTATLLVSSWIFVDVMGISTLESKNFRVGMDGA